MKSPQNRMFWLIVAGIAYGGQVAADANDHRLLFEQSIAPLVTKHCSGCHNPSDRKGGLDLTTREKMLAGGDSGAAIVPGNASESLIWHRVSSKEMPPKDPLSRDQEQLLERWIQGGADWFGGPLDPLKYTSSSRAGYDWWSFQPIQHGGRESNPSSAADNANPIDEWVEAKLRAAGLSLSPEADRRTLIRRVYFDLLGLPPDPADIRAFELDSSPTAYVRLVDRLLASPAYGERWARHWLDIVRFGESQGFERDKLRTNAWRYRDWVIDAWNRDLPYNEFARLQLAGDVLDPSDHGSLVATGFLVAGAYDEVGQQQQSAAMRAVVREDELEDILGTIGQTFLGLTINCSRCHDHKFDPIRQTEYYQLTAALAGVRHGERELHEGSESREVTAWSISLEGRIRQLEQKLASLEAPYREQLLAEWRTRREQQSPPKPLASWEFQDDVRDSLGTLHGELHAGAQLRDGQLILDGKGFVLTAPLSQDLREKTLEAWVTAADLSQRGGGIVSVQSLNGMTFDAIVFGEQEPRRWMAGSNSFQRTQSFQGEEEKSDQVSLHLAIVYRSDGTIVGYRNGVRYGKEYRTTGPQLFGAGTSQIAFGIRHSPAGGNRLWKGAMDRARLYDRALSDDEVAASAGSQVPSITESQLTAVIPADQLPIRANLVFELNQLRQQQTRIQERKIYAVTPRDPEATFLLVRGNPAQKGARIVPGAITALQGLSNFALPAESSDADRRRELAQWICHEQNPLFARVIVNRLWQYHFGSGLVETPNDLGFNGGRPSHPELLDWLATELMEHGWSLKHLQRILVSSATYCQSSRIRKEGQQVDADNRLLWRKAPQRLEAEALRDTLLSLSNELNRTMLGPGYFDFTTFTSNSQFYVPREVTGTSFQRRTIYRTWVRSGRSSFLDVFDCPDPSTKTPQRAVTTTPLQALSLLNNAFVLHMSERFAERVLREVGREAPQQVQRVFQLSLGREPDARELEMCVALVREHGLAELSRVIFNSSELMYVD